VPTCLKSAALSSRPKAPMMSSDACVVAPTVVAVGVPSFPVPVPIRSRAEVARRPENSLMLNAFATTAEENVTVIVPLLSVLRRGDDRITTRTPLVPEPFVASASTVYVFAGEPALSAHETVTVDGSSATATIKVLPTVAFAPVTVIVVAELSLPLVPTVPTSTGSAAAFSAVNATVSAVTMMLTACRTQRDAR